jgi:hypothetical protein
MNRIARTSTLTLTLVAITASTAYAAPPDRYECDDLENYQYDLMTMIPTEDLMVLGELLEKDVETMRASELRELSRITEEWAEELEDYPEQDIPYAATDYHKAFTESIGIISIITNAMETGGMFAILPYVDAVEDADLALTSAQLEGERMCGEDWPFGEDGGSI